MQLRHRPGSNADAADVYWCLAYRRRSSVNLGGGAYVWKIIKMPELYICARKIKKNAQFYMIFGWKINKLPEKYISRIWEGEGVGKCPLESTPVSYTYDSVVRRRWPIMTWPWLWWLFQVFSCVEWSFYVPTWPRYRATAFLAGVWRLTASHYRRLMRFIYVVNVICYMIKTVIGLLHHTG